MRTSTKYVITLLVVAVLIVAPGGVAHILGASDELLFRLGVLQLLALIVLSIISFVSALALSLSAAFEKEWLRAAAMVGVAAIPLAAGFLAVLTNPLGWEAAMSV